MDDFVDRCSSRLILYRSPITRLITGDACFKAGRIPVSVGTSRKRRLTGPVCHGTYVRYSSGVEKPVLALSELQLGGHVQKFGIAQDRLLPLRSDLMPLFPWGGLKRGTVVEITSSVLTMALLAEATTQGSWAAVVGSPEMGLAAARGQGVALERLVVVHRPPLDQAAAVIAALVDALDFVVVGPRLLQRSVDARRLSARARERGSVLVSRGGWLEGPDVSLHVRAQHFTGMAEGHGHLAGWSIDVETSGRGAASRPRRARLTLAEVADTTLESTTTSTAVSGSTPPHDEQHAAAFERVS